MSDQRKPDRTVAERVDYLMERLPIFKHEAEAVKPLLLEQFREALEDQRKAFQTVLVNVAAYGTKRDPCWCSSRDHREDNDHDDWCVAAQDILKGQANAK